MNRPKRTHFRVPHPTFPFSESTFDVVALAASPGGLEGLAQVLTALPSDFPAALILVRHISPGFVGELAALLGRDTELRVKEADDGDWLAPGIVFIAPPGHYLQVNPDGTLSLSLPVSRFTFSPLSADPLFSSLSASCRGRAIGVVLSRGDPEGSLGLRAFRHAGGIVIAEEEFPAAKPSRATASVARRSVDQLLPLAEIAPALVRLARQRLSPEAVS